MTKNVKDVYQDEAVVADMVERFTAVSGDEFTDEDRAAVVTELSDELGKPEASIRAKLVREKVYRAKTHKTKTGEPTISKAKLVDQIAGTAGINLTDAEGASLEKATKNTLKKILSAFEALHSEIDMTDIESID
jgi:hypothetical protein